MLELSEIKSPIYIFPASCIGIVVYHMMKKQGITVLGFCDNNKADGDKNYDNRPVLTPAQAVNTTADASFIIASCRYRKDMADQLKSLGVSNVIYAEQILTSEKAEESLRDFNEGAAAKIITEFKSPKLIAKNELPYYLMSIPDADLQRNMKIAKPIDVDFYSAGYESECNRFDRLAKNADCINFVTVLNTFAIYGNVIDYISYILKSKIFINNIVFYIRYAEEYLEKTKQLYSQIKKLGIEVEKYYSSKFAENGEVAYDFKSSKTIATMIIEDTPYNNFENEHKCVFIHIPKTSGLALCNYLGADPKHFRSHKSIHKCKDYNENVFMQYFKFTIVRNPWDRFVSQYFFNKTVRIKSNYNEAELRDTSIMRKTTFKDAVLALKNNEIEVDSQHEWICDENGNILVDYVGRFEKLAESYEYIAKKIGVYTGKPLAKINASEHKPYQEYYDEESKEIVGQYFKKDIEIFGYTFD